MPRIYINTSKDLDSAHDVNFYFDQVHVNTGSKLHLAIVREGAQLKCYVNGVLKQTLACNYTADLAMNGVGLGGDFRAYNDRAFKGTIYSATMFSDARTASEITSDKSGISTSAEGLVAHYDLTNVTDRSSIKDLSGNGYDMAYRYGLTFGTDTLYKPEKPITEIPKTFEATVCFPADTPASTRGGIILGNYPTAQNISFEIGDNGVPRLYIDGADYYNAFAPFICSLNTISLILSLIRNDEPDIANCLQYLFPVCLFVFFITRTTDF